MTNAGSWMAVRSDRGSYVGSRHATRGLLMERELRIRQAHDAYSNNRRGSADVE